MKQAPSGHGSLVVSILLPLGLTYALPYTFFCALSYVLCLMEEERTFTLVLRGLPKNVFVT